ncbi:MAG: PEP-CTERM sorting domain-containing protein [Phycisphaeraceae bacterium]|nr:PEP-CTERM sorting domain-containing protein [Phycisphaeraceae bacterium]
MKRTLFGFTAAALLAGSAHAVPVINEFVVNHTSTDTNEYIEIFGDASTDYSDLTILEIEGEGSSAGLIDDNIISVGTTDSNGIWWTGFDPGGSNDFENSTLTLLLVSGFTGSTGDDIDTNDDGVIDATFWTAIIDSVGVRNDVAGDFIYSTADLVEGYDGNSFEVGGASRLPDGVDTDTASDWVRNDFDGEGIPGFSGSVDAGEALNTPGTLNIPEPGSLALLGLGGLLIARRRRG